MPTFIFAAVTDIEFERALSQATWYVHIKDRHPFLWLPSCSHDSGSSSKFNKAGTFFKLVFFFFRQYELKVLSTSGVEVPLSQPMRSLDQRRTQSSSGVTQRDLVLPLGVPVTKDALVFERLRGVSQALAPAPCPAEEASFCSWSPSSSGLTA